MKNINQLIIAFITLLLSNAVIALEVDAITGWSNRVEIGAQVSGVITLVKVTTGQQVKKGELLLQFDQRLFKAQYNNTRAQVASMKEVMLEAKRELERSLVLYEQTILAEHELQAAKNANKKAQADYKQKLAENIHAKIDLEQSTIRAPFNAVILNVLRNKGESIKAVTTTPLIIVIAETGRMKATGNVASDVLNNIKKDQAAEVSVSGKTYKGTVKSIGLEPEQGSHLYKVEVEFLTTDLIRAGSKASISL